MRVVTLVTVAAVVLAGCGSSGSDTDTALRETIRGGAAAMRTERGKALEQKLTATLAALRRDRPSTAADRRGRSLAIQGCTWALVSVRAELEFELEDRGQPTEAARDAKRADTARRKSERLLRAAARELGVGVGRLDRL